MKILLVTDQFYFANNGMTISSRRLAAVLAERGIPTRLLLRNVGDALPPQGTVSQLWQSLGLDAQGIAQAVREVLA